jgi:hypothetical protein
MLESHSDPKSLSVAIEASVVGGSRRVLVCPRPYGKLPFMPERRIANVMQQASISYDLADRIACIRKPDPTG